MTADVWDELAAKDAEIIALQEQLKHCQDMRDLSDAAIASQRVEIAKLFIENQKLKNFPLQILSILGNVKHQTIGENASRIYGDKLESVRELAECAKTLNEKVGPCHPSAYQTSPGIFIIVNTIEHGQLVQTVTECRK